MEDELGALKLKWKLKKYDFTAEQLLDMLNPIAEVDSLALSEKKKGSAVVVFKTVVGAVSARLVVKFFKLTLLFVIVCCYFKKRFRSGIIKI